MRAETISRERVREAIHLVLLGAAVATYLIVPEDVVWGLIRSSPHARMLEHVLFGLAAAMLGGALLLEVGGEPVRGESVGRDAVASLLQAMGIGALLPLPGLLLLVVGETGLSLLMPRSSVEAHGGGWRDRWLRHAGLGCAFVSMVVFSVVLKDRVADWLFGVTGLVAVSAWGALRLGW